MSNKITIPSGQELAEALRNIADRFSLEFWSGIFEEGQENILRNIFANYTNFTGVPIDEDDIELVEYKETGRSYKDFNDWVDGQVLAGDTFYYARPRQNFSRYEAYGMASRLGKRKLILEDLS